MRQELKNVLQKIANLLSDEAITWALGASSVLYYHGLTDTVNDIDILVEKKDYEKLEMCLLTIGVKVKTEAVSTYETEYFGEFVIDGVEIDVMANMTVINHNLRYVYHFSEDNITDCMVVGTEKVPMTSLEDWYILYHMIPNKEKKADMLDHYFKDHPVIHKHLMLGQTIPEWLYEKIKKLT